MRALARIVAALANDPAMLTFGSRTLVSRDLVIAGSRKQPSVRVRCVCGREQVVNAAAWVSRSSRDIGRECAECSRKVGWAERRKAKGLSVESIGFFGRAAESRARGNAASRNGHGGSGLRVVPPMGGALVFGKGNAL